MWETKLYADRKDNFISISILQTQKMRFNKTVYVSAHSQLVTVRTFKLSITEITESKKPILSPSLLSPSPSLSIHFSIVL